MSDPVPWSSLTHARGPAADLPGHLQALTSADPAVRAAAFDALWATLWDQGTRYPATAPAVRALVRLFDAPWPRDPDRLLGLLTGCVAGFLSPATGPYSASGTAWGARFAASGAVGERGYLDLLWAVEEEAAAAVPAAIRLLESGPRRVRAAAAWFLASLAGRVDVAPAIRAAVEARLSVRGGFPVEPDERVRATLVLALGHLLPAGAGAALVALEADESPLVLLVAAAMGVRREGAAAPAQAIDPLVAVLETTGDLDGAYRGLPWQSDGVVGEVAALLSAAGPAVLARVRPTLHARLASAWGFDAVGVLQAALADAFGAAQAPASSVALSPAQRGALEALVANTALFSLDNVATLLTERGLPPGRDALAAWAGLAAPPDPLGVARGEARVLDRGPDAPALQAWERVLALVPQDPEALCAAGRLLLARGDSSLAVTLLERACAADPAHGEARFHLGHAYSQLARDEEALAAFELAAGVLGDAGPARRNRVAMLQRLGRVQEAAALLLTEEPEDAEGWFERSLALVKAGRLEEAVAAGRRAVEQLPDHGGAHYTLACAHALRHEPEPALAHAELALRHAPELAEELARDPDLESLRADPRFRELTRGSVTG